MISDLKRFLVIMLAVLTLSPALSSAEEAKVPTPAEAKKAFDGTPGAVAEPLAVDETATAEAEEEPLADDEEAVLDEDTEYSYGTVASIGDNEIQVKEYDYDSGADVSVNYALDAKIKFEGAASLKDVSVGDNVEIDYLDKDGKKTILIMSVEKPFTEEEKSNALRDEGQAEEPKEEAA